MVIVCPGCKNRITIDDATVPEGAFKVRCTGCGRSITTQRKEEAAAAAPAPRKQSSKTAEADAVTPSMESYVNTQIATAKKEILDAIQSLFRGASIAPTLPGEDTVLLKRALICSGDSKTAETLARIVAGMGYETQSCASAGESQKNLDASFGLIVIDPSFTDDLEGARKIIGRINVKKGIERRKTFLVLLSSTQKSLDGTAAFTNGVNLIVNKADLNHFESFVHQSQQDFHQMYSAFRSVAP